MRLLSFIVQNCYITLGFILANNKVHSSSFKQKSLYYRLFLTQIILEKSRELNWMLGSQNDPTRNYAENHQRCHWCYHLLFDSHENQMSIHSYSRIFLTDVGMKGLQNSSHKKKQLAFVPDVYFCLSSLVYVYLFGGRQSHWNPDALKSNKYVL